MGLQLSANFSYLSSHDYGRNNLFGDGSKLPVSDYSYANRMAIVKVTLDFSAQGSKAYLIA